MEEGLAVFKNDFLPHVDNWNLSEGEKISFGDMRFDYDLYLKADNYFLTVYYVALDHYGMPYRNVLHSVEYIIEKH